MDEIALVSTSPVTWVGGQRIECGELFGTKCWTLDNLGLDHRIGHYTDLLVPNRFPTISSGTMTPVDISCQPC
jgi:hypothetical protein